MAIKIGVLSDTHLHRVSRDLREIYEKYLSGMDLILHAGDFTSPEVVSFLSRKGFHGVHGNMDPLAVKVMLPDKKVIDLGGYRFGLIHGWGASEGLEERIWDQFQNVDVIVYGHSHKSANYVREGTLLFNPGTATGFTSCGMHSIGVLECGDAVRGEIINLDDD